MLLQRGLCHAEKVLGGREGVALHALLHPDSAPVRGLEGLARGVYTREGFCLFFQYKRYIVCCDERFQDSTDTLNWDLIEVDCRKNIFLSLSNTGRLEITQDKRIT